MSKGKVFTAQEVQAIIVGNKTQFREAVKVQPPTYIKNVNFAGQGTWEWGNSGVYVEEPYQKGQKIFVKEGQVFYKQSLAKAGKHFWKPASQMKQEQSRLTLLIKEIRVERLADISEEDAIAEGNYLDRCACLPRKKDKSPIDAMFKQNWCHIHGQEFKDAWNAIHKKPEEKFETNPFVWSIQFEVVNE
jgi:hypothetical protein